MKRYVLLSATNTFKYLGPSASLTGCENDSPDFINEVLKTVWGKSGWDAGYDLRGHLDTAEALRGRLDELVAKMKPEDDFVYANSSHGTHYYDWMTGEFMSCTVTYDSDWNVRKSFVSKRDFQRAFEKLPVGARAFCFFDSCESGNMGQNFKLLDSFTKKNRWVESPPASRVVESAVDVRLPKQVCTMAGCAEKGTCADIGGSHPHGAFSAARNKAIKANPKGTWYQWAKAVDAIFASEGEEQRQVSNGPDVVVIR